MPTNVSDTRSNSNDQIAHAAAVIGRSTHRRLVFEAVSSGKKAVKTVEEIAAATGLTRKQVLDAGKTLVHNHVFEQARRNGDTAYVKDSFLAARRKKVLSLASDRGKLEAFPTKTRPAASARPPVVHVKLPRNLVRVTHVTVDDIYSLRAVRKVAPKSVSPVAMPETRFKKGFQAVIGEKGIFKDWGGEKNDLWTTRLQLKSRRLRAAIAFKGPGKRGKLTPGKMGKNGDQLQRLFASDADVFLVQYWGEVEQSVYEQMNALAIARSVAHGGADVTYGVLDGIDSARLIAAYPEEFG